MRRMETGFVMVESLFRGHYARPAAPDNSVRIGMFIATAPPGHPQLRRSGMFIGTATNNDLRKLRQERHGTIRLLPNPTCRS